jgi:RNA polymerase sigma-70 factor (ECF subfamily)
LLLPNLNYNRERIVEGFDEREFKKTFEELFLSSFRPLCYYCQHKFGLDYETASDTVHNAFINLWDMRNTLYGYDTLKAYVYKICANNCLNIIDHDSVKQKHEKYILQNCLSHSFENPDVDLILRELQNSVAELPDQMRMIFTLSREKGLKYFEIANFLNISIKTVETQMSRALRRLRKEFKR